MLSNIQIKHSTRAKSLQLKVTHYGDVIVVVPRTMRHVKLSTLIEDHRSWIEQKLQSLESRRLLDKKLDCEEPAAIELRAIGVQYHINYQSAARPGISTEYRTLKVNTTPQNNPAKQLQQWLQANARKVLPQWLVQCSQQTGLQFSKVTIRGQRTRWGSCTSKGNISLNRNLLFLDPELVSYLMLHELCHTRYMNHSKQYWDFVMSFEPDFKRLENELSHAYRYVPRWAVASHA